MSARRGPQPRVPRGCQPPARCPCVSPPVSPRVGASACPPRPARGPRQPRPAVSRGVFFCQPPAGTPPPPPPQDAGRLRPFPSEPRPRPSVITSARGRRRAGGPPGPAELGGSGEGGCRGASGCKKRASARPRGRGEGRKAASSGLEPPSLGGTVVLDPGTLARPPRRGNAARGPRVPRCSEWRGSGLWSLPSRKAVGKGWSGWDAGSGEASRVHWRCLVRVIEPRSSP